ncbi:MAG TPA: VCBS repeat-containing protein, partial [Candidatus Brocadiia bacterium]|nr:VCBS repeat-containing protein [Candidatus Brocadiia bacterium]
PDETLRSEARSFTALNRMWIVDHTYQVRDFNRHSGVLPTRDGVDLHPDRDIAKLLNLAQGKTWAVSRSSLGLWDRAIYWSKGRFFAVLDRVTADKPGDYMARCMFKTLGAATLEPGRLELEQKGRYCRILTEGSGRASAKAIPDLSQAEWRSFYPYAQPTPTYYCQDKTRRLEAGQSLGFINVLHAFASPDQAQSVTLKPVAEHAALITDQGQPTLLGLGGPSKEEPADFYAVTKTSVVCLGARALCGGRVAASEPCDLGLDASAQTLFVQNANPVRVELRDPPPVADGQKPAFVVETGHAVFSLSPGSHELSIKGWKGFDALTAWSANALASAGAAAGALAAARPAAQPEPEISGLAIEDVAFDMPINVLEPATINGAKAWIAGGADGVRAYGPGGARLWSFDTKKPVRAIAVADADGDGAPEIAVGCDDEHVYLLGAGGKPRWSYRCKPSQDSTMGLPPIVDQVWIADLDADGKSEVIAGANWLHVLNLDGSLRWERYMMARRGRIAGDFACGAVADLNGDGKKELIALFNTSYSLLFAYDADGKIVFPMNADGTAPDPEGLATSVSPRIETARLFPDRKQPQIVFGYPGRLICVWSDQRRREDAGYYSRVQTVDFHVFQPSGADPVLARRTGRTQADATRGAHRTEAGRGAGVDRGGLRPVGGLEGGGASRGARRDALVRTALAGGCAADWLPHARTHR